ncbi:MAG: MFS transporter [Dehalococcoidia bacterium]|nr:MFS transporter [Dehalococcoidia bacterium]
MLSYTRFFSRIAQNALNFALVLLITQETDRVFLSSLLVLALVVPSTVAGIVAGTAADVLPKRPLVLLGDLARAAVCVWFIRGSGDAATYYLVAIALSTFGQFATNAEGAIMPSIVEKPDLARANALNQAIGGAAQVIGLGVLTPVMLRVFDNPDALFLVCAALFSVAGVQALFIGRIKHPARAEVGGEPQGHWWLAGWRALRGDHLVFHAAVELTLISTALIILGGLIPSYISDVLDMPVDIGALLLTPAAVGVVLGLRVAGFLAHRVPHAALSSLGFTGFVVSLALVTFANQEAEFLGGYGAFWWLDSVSVGSFDGGALLALILVFPLGFAFAVVSVAGQTVLNDRIPLHLQGRAGSTQAAMAAVASSLPVLAAGALADLVGVIWVMALLSAGIGVVALSNIRPQKHGDEGAPARGPAVR